jgi:thiaminase/transcriptional activator TenA
MTGPERGDRRLDPVPAVPARFADSDHDRYSTWLRARTGEDWTAATEHRFVRELAADELADAVFRRYLVQDHAFVDALTSLVGHAAGHAPTVEERVRLAEFLTTVGTDEEDYFRRSFDALSVPEADRTEPAATPATLAFEDLLARAAGQGYAAALATLTAVEWIYLDWATTAAEGPRPERFYLDEWIDLHAVAGFREFVAWMRERVDAVGPRLSRRRERRVDRLFRRAVALEVAFFDAAYGTDDAAGPLA